MSCGYESCTLLRDYAFQHALCNTPRSAGERDGESGVLGDARDEGGAGELVAEIVEQADVEPGGGGRWGPDGYPRRGRPSGTAGQS